MYISKNYQKEAYLYSDFFRTQSSKSKPKMYVLPSILSYVKQYDPKKHDPYTMTNEMAKVFESDSQNPQNAPNLEDMAKSEIDQARSRTDLILGDIKGRVNLRNENLNSLYKDLFRIYNWRNCRTFPETNATDKTWLEFNKLELDIRDKIRRELKDSIKDTSFAGKDLRESLLDHRNKSLESMALDNVSLDDNIDGIIQDQKNSSNISYNDNYR